MRSSKHEEAAKKQRAAGREKKERALQDLISVKFFFCHNVKSDRAFSLWIFLIDSSSSIFVLLGGTNIYV